MHAPRLKAQQHTLEEKKQVLTKALIRKLGGPSVRPVLSRKVSR